MKCFKNVESLQELRKQYKELLKVHHPDNGGNVAQMQEVNAEYDSLFKFASKKKAWYYRQQKYQILMKRMVIIMMKKSIKTIGAIVTVGIMLVCAYLLGTTQSETVTEIFGQIRLFSA